MDLITTDKDTQLEHMNLIRDRDSILKSLKSKMPQYATIEGKPLSSEPDWENHIKYDVLPSPSQFICKIEYRIRQTLDGVRFGYSTTGYYLAWLE